MTAAAVRTRFGFSQPPRLEWLGRAVPEAPLEPDREIIDAHQHLWIRPGVEYLLPQFCVDLDCGHKVEATIFCECHMAYRPSGPDHLRSVGETEFAVGMSALSRSGLYSHQRVADRIIGFVDLTLGGLTQEALEAHITAAGGRFCGVRHRASFDPDPAIGSGGTAPGLYLDPAFGDGLDRLADHGLPLDAAVFFTQLGDVGHLADRHPDSTIVLNHCGGPLGYGAAYVGRSDEVHAEWLRGMTELARRPNVNVKLGGLMIRLAAFDYDDEHRPPTSEELAALWRPYVEPCLQLFGAERCLVESNFPVEKMGIGYGALWNTFKRITAEASDSEKAAIYAGNARRIYGVNE